MIELDRKESDTDQNAGAGKRLDDPETCLAIFMAMSIITLDYR